MCKRLLVLCVATLIGAVCLGSNLFLSGGIIGACEQTNYDAKVQGVSANDTYAEEPIFKSLASENINIIITQFDFGGIIYYMQFPTSLSAAQIKIVLNRYDFSKRSAQKIDYVHNETGEARRITYDYSAGYEIDVKADYTTVTLGFENYYTFIAFSGLSYADYSAPQTKIDTSLFFREATVQLGVSYDKFFGANMCGEIVRELKFLLARDLGVNSYFVYSSQARRSSVSGDYQIIRSDDGGYNYKYILGVDFEDITVFDRRANTPIWYVIAVAITAIVCLVYYFSQRYLSSHSRHLEG